MQTLPANASSARPIRPIDVLHLVAAVGGHMRPNGVKIRLEAKAPLPQELIALVRTHRIALLAILNPKPPRHAGGLPLTDANHPCSRCSSIEWQQYITYRYCLTCGLEEGPGAIVDDQRA
jgi:hypothetical protein